MAEQQQQVDPNQLLHAMQMQVAAQVGEMLQKKVKLIVNLYCFFREISIDL